MADNNLTTSVIMLGLLGSMALANKERLLSSLMILSKPYCNKHVKKVCNQQFTYLQIKREDVTFLQIQYNTGHKYLKSKFLVS